MEKYIPRNCVWELTLKCDMHCLHCGSTAGKERQDELSLDECKRVAHELIDLGCERISMIGGEVFLYKGWEEIARVFSSNGVLTNIITNGYRFGKEEIEKVRYAGLTNVCFSVDGLEENHDRIRNRKGSFKRVLEDFELCRKENVLFAVVTTLLDFNFGDLEGMYSLLLDNGAGAWQIQLANSMGNLADSKGLTIAADKMPLLTEFIKRKKDERKLSIYAADDIGYYDENEKYLRGDFGRESYWTGCQAGLTVIGIDSIGNVKGCESLYDERFIEGNVRTEKLVDIWNKQGNFSYNRNFSKNQLGGNCADCAMGDQCRGGCKGSSYFNKGDIFENPYCSFNAQRIAQRAAVPVL